jgi:hypothetical protein
MTPGSSQADIGPDQPHPSTPRARCTRAFGVVIQIAESIFRRPYPVTMEGSVIRHTCCAQNGAFLVN